ncbi:RNA polymerase sigma factor [Zavarzinella formosa]|uniref:RNA polymerase sigma factor n=1 Tax=Zavarzinella formosa TaxID=360055 RepID=UPI0002E1BE4E|nr:sigma-70 family RNA polymerase sigma factor [Zavarzinella formosa]
MTDWSLIVRQHGPIVWRTAWRLLNNDADASDCFQHAFISALELERKETIRNWPALLKRLATARALESFRQRNRESNRRTTLAEMSVIDRKETGPVAAAEANELGGHLREALAGLDDRQAQIFCLSCLDGLSYQEIAEQLDITVNHVGVLLNRARAALRERLRAFEPSPAVEQITQEFES